MQRNQMIALVAGVGVGVAGGGLGAFLAWEAVGAAGRHLLDQFGDQDDQVIELEQPALSATQHGTQQVSSGSVPVMLPASDPSLPESNVAVISAQAL
jgi:hypothetical protein